MFPETAITGASCWSSSTTLSWVKSPACRMRFTPLKIVKILFGMAFALEGIWVSEIKPTSFNLALSFDLSLAPSVVGALSPTIGASFQLAGFALCTVEGSGSSNPSSQASVLSKKKLHFDISISILLNHERLNNS